jgi:hypothetical protein
MDGEAGQQFNPQDLGPVNAWPSRVVSYLFPAGAFQFLDGGKLDLGIVRDSTLNAANDFMTFPETFEAVMFRGGEALRINQAVTPTGISRAARDPMGRRDPKCEVPGCTYGAVAEVFSPALTA